MATLKLHDTDAYITKWQILTLVELGLPVESRGALGLNPGIKPRATGRTWEIKSDPKWRPRGSFLEGKF